MLTLSQHLDDYLAAKRMYESLKGQSWAQGDTLQAAFNWLTESRKRLDALAPPTKGGE